MELPNNPNKRNVLDPDQARSMRKGFRVPDRNVEEDEADEEFHDKPDEAIEKNKKELKNTKIKDQIEYFGYVLEPFNMNNEKKYGNIDGDGFFVFDKQKEKEIRDPWLDALDQDPYHQGLNQQEVDAKDEFQEINPKVKIDVLNQDFNNLSENKQEPIKVEKISRFQMIEMVEKLLKMLEIGENPNGLIKRLRPVKVKQKVFKKNIRKNREPKANKDVDEEDLKEETGEKTEIFKEIIEICDILTSNGCLEIYSQTKEEITEFLNEKLKKNIGLEDNFIDSDVEFKHSDVESSDSDDILAEKA